MRYLLITLLLITHVYAKDHALRALLGVSSIEFEMPKPSKETKMWDFALLSYDKAKHCTALGRSGVSVLAFKDKVEVLQRKNGDKFDFRVSTEGQSFGYSIDAFDYDMSSAGSIDPQKRPVMEDGWTVVAYWTFGDQSANETIHYSDFKENIGSCKRVLAVAIREQKK